MSFPLNQPAQHYRSDTSHKVFNTPGYSLQAPAKQKEGTTHPGRNAQFAYLNSRLTPHLRAGEPVISVDTKKKELVGDFHNGGREWQPSGQPEPVRVHDFIDPGLGKAIPYGIYDLSNDEGWVSVGDTADTAEFAANTIRRWWHQMGQHRFGDATRLLITADAGGSNGYRIRAWKTHLAALASRNRPDHHRMPLPARHLEMEQDRTPHVQLHHSSTGEAGPSPPYAPSSSSSPPPPPKPGSPSKPTTTRPNTPKAPRSATPNSPPSPSPDTTGTATGTTPSAPHETTNQIRGGP